ncbi:hypothetical protein DAPPUDRAFT_336556 [Daphnia pulex]|uniref:DNA topoisomerase (ATP-hydrolyzing) n=1 Tax=Daphnia pulex TaxID=6669 RepID=E9HZW8_DAPPU|nr:hypothetical protein DAPPUDRAFT_336556 [Daphnia pulex]|eukprot:EFX62712.1 hypothetical protein DAPPUDRAFT_336556 [Daphnia pulex]
MEFAECSVVKDFWKIYRANKKAEQTAHFQPGLLMRTIVCMAQDFVGRNNVNLLIRNGQFGTRHQVGKYAASHRLSLER